MGWAGDHALCKCLEHRELQSKLPGQAEGKNDEKARYSFFNVPYAQDTAPILTLNKERPSSYKTSGQQRNGEVLMLNSVFQWQ